ncbi:uncharacterized protein LOC103872917 [Brassica rapa]|uniref:Retrotransposon Copia-like N-terminal domain-containing protein n=1 Tax=Brassica campestris TaxID=3711 RepID=M4EAS6_BRACM|nr:uncharacterized protein LOC103872917 [Brassica rapa]
MAESMTSLSPELDPRSPYYIDPDYQPNENLPMVILSQAEDNYFIWKRHFLQPLLSKSKTDFVNGTFATPPEPSSPLYEAWRVCDARVKCWMMNCVSENLQDYVRYADTAHKAWDDLRMIFVPGVDFKIYQLRQRIPTLRQDGDSLPRYFGKMRIAWMELWEYDRLPECACGGCRCEIKKRAEEAREKEERYAFLMGLNQELSFVRTQIMIMDPPPSLKEAYSLVYKAELRMSSSRC